MPDKTPTLADFTAPGLLLPALRTRRTASVIGELCAALERANRLSAPLAFYDAVLRHEQACCTAIAPGWALPHARLPGLARLSFALGRSAVDLDWLERGEHPVRLVFLCAVPDADSSTYMALLSGLARLSQDPVLLESLHRAPDSQAMFAILQQIRLRPMSSASQVVAAEPRRPLIPFSQAIK